MSGHDPTDLEGQELEREEAVAKAKQQLQLEISDFKWIVSNKRGRRFIWRILEKASVFQPTYIADSDRSAFNEGQRNQGLWIFAMVMEHAPETFHLMQTEHKEHDRSNHISTR